jgi:sugar phosphate permease
MLFSIAMFGICIIGFALSTNYILSFVCLMFSGVFDEVSVVVRSTIVQLYAPEEMRGRVESVSKIFIGSSNEIGAFESGTAARFMGLVPSVVFGATITLLVVGIAYKKLPKIKDLEFL